MHDWEIYREIVLRTQRLLHRAEAAARRRLVQAARMRVSPTRTIDLLLRTDRAAAVGAPAAPRPGRPRRRSSRACPSG